MCRSKVNSVKVSVNRTVNRIKEGEDKCLTAVLALKDGMDMASAFMGEGPWVLRELGLKQAFSSTFFFFLMGRKSFHIPTMRVLSLLGSFFLLIKVKLT